MSRDTPALFEAHPELRGALPWTPLVRGPTDVVRWEALGRHLGTSQLYAKRDDLTHRRYGGNKVRKLEWLFGDAIRHERPHLLTAGALGSNHVLATGYHGRQNGLTVSAFAWPRPMNDAVRRIVDVTEALGVTLHHLPSPLLYPGALVAERLRRRRRKTPTTVIPSGGSNAIGMLGLVDAVFELAEQVREGQMPEPKAIFVPGGTGGTAAGLWLGCRLAGLQSQVVAVRVVPSVVLTRVSLVHKARATWRHLQRAGCKAPVPALNGSDVTILGGHLGPGYGTSSRLGDEAANVLNTLEHQEVDPVYSAKALAGMMAELMRWQVLRHQPVLFWLTASSASLSRIRPKP